MGERERGGGRGGKKDALVKVFRSEAEITYGSFQSHLTSSAKTMAPSALRLISPPSPLTPSPNSLMILS